MTREIELGEKIIVVEEQSGLADEVGATVWDCSLVLTHFLEVAPEAALRDKRIVELGSGTGVVGLAAAALGAAEVLLTDRPHLLEGLQANITANLLQGRVRCAPLEWGSDEESHREVCGGLLHTFDVVLLSDCCYDAEATAALVATVRQLAHDQSTVWLAHELRPTSKAVFETLLAEGVKYRKLQDDELHPDWTCEDISIFELSL